MLKYKVETTDYVSMEGVINKMAKEGWKPVLMSSVQPLAQTILTVTVIFEKVSP